jgi:hypothetical protein
MEDLVRIALGALPRMHDPASGLYAHKTLLGASGQHVNHGLNPLYSAATVVGLLAAEQAGFAGVPARTVPGSLDAMHRLSTTSRDPAMLAVLSWASALANDPRMQASLARMFAMLDPRTASSMDLGLALTAAAHATTVPATPRDRIIDRAASLAGELRRRYTERGGVFRAFGRHRRPRSLALAKMTSFASQIYPVHGLCEYARLLEHPPDAEIASVCGRVCASQGPLGQWWWFYAVGERTVVEGYPVYSVHQDGMAFMALGAAERIGEGRYRAQLERGLRWVSGENELATSMVIREPPFICRAIQLRGGDPDGLAGWSSRQRRRAVWTSWAPARRAVGVRGAGELEVLRECRSYHLGWLLYAATLIKAPQLGVR